MWLIFPVWPLIRQSYMSKLNVNIIFAKIFNLSNFAKPPMLLTRTLLSKLINSLSFYLKISVKSAYLNKWHNCKFNKCFIVSLSENHENMSFPVAQGS